jgi:oxygen-independent coproporphyrinogen-3 oxidase
MSIPVAPPRGFGIYIHWPFCLSKCPYCDFNSHVRERVDHEAWRSALLRELAYYAARTRGQTVSSIFFGGGTPSLMPPALVAALIEAVAQHWSVAPGLEITLEANPTSVEAANFRALASAGVNRVSLGVQALDDAALKFLGRGHSAREALAAVDLAGSVFPRFSFDLIYGRPGQTVAAWQAELKQALGHAGEHLSLYTLTIEANTGFAGAVKRGEWAPPDDEAVAALFDATADIMAQAGRPAYEISNHARPGAECRHNLTYWRYGDYAGIGPGAHGRVHTATSRLATRNLKRPEAWLDQVMARGHGAEAADAVAPGEAAIETMLMGLRLAEGVHEDNLREVTGRDFAAVIDPVALARLAAAGMVERDGPVLRASAAGRQVLDSVLASLLR